MIYWYFPKAIPKDKMNSPHYTTTVLKFEETKGTEIKSEAILGYDKENKNSQNKNAGRYPVYMCKC